MMTSVLIILPYFGILPKMFPFWLESCKLNPSIDFLIVTDQQINNMPPNVKILKTTLENIKRRISVFVGFEVCLEKPYKLCDYKPLYGEIFEEFTSDYTFWGYCDCDLIFGDIRKFITEDIFQSYDYIGGMGHFHLQRTIDPKFELVWRTANATKDCNKKWKEVFTSNENEFFDELPRGVSGRYYDLYPNRFYSGFFPTHCIFDEPVHTNHKFFIGIYNNYQRYLTYKIYTNHAKRLKFWERQLSPYQSNVVYKKDGARLLSIGIENGKITERELLYVHFYKRCFRYHTNSYSNYLIRPNTFFNNRELTISKLKLYPFYWDVNCQLLSIKIRNRLNRYFGVSFPTLWS